MAHPQGLADDEIERLKTSAPQKGKEKEEPAQVEQKLKAVRTKAFKNITESYRIDMTHLHGDKYMEHFQRILPVVEKKLTKVVNVASRVNEACLRIQREVHKTFERDYCRLFSEVHPHCRPNYCYQRI